MHRLRIHCIFLLMALLSACVQPRQPSPFTGFYKNYANCREDYKQMDARIDAAGVRDATYYRVPGFPYMRTDRMLASFRNEVSGLDDTWEWTRRMRELDQESRDFEYINLGLSEYDASLQRDRLANCGRVLAAIELKDPAIWKKLVQAAQPPDDYSGFMRVLGLYPLNAPAMKSRLKGAHEAWLANYRNAATTPADAAMQLWSVKPVEDMSLLDDVQTRVEVNVLNYPGLIGSAWRALAERHAPQLWIETRTDNDKPATPRYTKSGITADANQPAVYYQIGYTRFGGVTLVQVSYFAWFKSSDGAATGPVDGLVWRVTLDALMQPVTYESLHASGLDHRWYPVMSLQPLALPKDQEPAFIAPEPAPASNMILRVCAGTHDVQRLAEAGAVSGSAKSLYELHAYEELYTLARPDGGTRSLFDPDGIVAGAYGSDPIGGFSSGIVKPGAPRQSGHQPIAHVGRRHFDDPHLMESAFVAPPPSNRPKPTESADLQ